jgi:hypothetical protein
MTMPSGLGASDAALFLLWQMVFLQDEAASND